MLRLLAILLLCVPVSAQQLAASAGPGKLTIESIFAEGGITGRGPETIKWSPDNTKISFVQRDDSGEHGQLWYIDVASGHKAVLVAESKLQSLFPPDSRMTAEQRERAQRYSVAAYQWAPDSKHLLFDSRGQLWYYSLDTGTAVQLTAAPDASTDPKFSPDGKHIAYVRKHDLWVRPVSEGEEKQVTRDGNENLLNGEVDWVYEEELGVRSNYFWSPDSKHFVFLQMNEKQLPTYPLVDWMPTHPKVNELKYPKAGDPNPEVRVGVVAADGGKVRWISVGDPNDKDVYKPRFGWLRNGAVYVTVINRLHTRMDLYFADAFGGRSRLVLSESEPNAYLDDERFHITWLKSGDRFLWPSWRDGHMHLYLYSFDKYNPLAADAKLEQQLTKGEFEVSGVQGVDEAAGTVYLTANAGDPRQEQVYAVKLGGGEMQKITQTPGVHNANFAGNGQFFIDSYSALLSPPRLALCKVAGTCSTFWEARAVSDYNLIAPRALELKAADGQTTLYAYLLLPPGAEQAGAAKIPVILNPYGGPGGQVVRDSWGGVTFLFHNILARHGFAILQVDNRGMANRGRAFATPILHHLGQVELQDQLAALDQVLKQFPALDANRVGWWGWSYGGYMTLYAMTHSDRVKAGVSVAPVTDWRDYDSIYTERYMGLPKDNATGYADSSPVNAAQALHGKLLEVHGTSDDNVHLQNTMQMMRSLINAGKQFDLQLYPGKTHGISGKADRTHLFHRIQQQFEQYLMGPQP
ncbi:MAG: alpha/beta fold hydrolase [Acidobacteriia bacterium]|nr:alpha/beta fold hydrolase [Terriglobia bacterium]